jgi:hypothetical protein
VGTAGVFVLDVAAIALAVSLPLPVLGSRLRGQAVTVVTAVLAVLAIATLVYLFTAEGYTNDGRTVWEAANWPRRWLLLAGALLAAAAVRLAVMARRRLHLVPLLAGATILVAAINLVALTSTVE